MKFKTICLLFPLSFCMLFILGRKLLFLYTSLIMMVMMGLVVSLVSFKAAELNLKIEGLTTADCLFDQSPLFFCYILFNTFELGID